MNINLNIDGVNAGLACHVVDDKLLDVLLLVGQTFTEQAHIVVHKDAENLRFFNFSDELPFSISDNAGDMAIVVQSKENITVHGPASIRVCVNIENGDILLHSKVIGKPNRQTCINGGVYSVKEGQFFVSITPLCNP